jgi:hypothetical protein
MDNVAIVIADYRTKQRIQLVRFSIIFFPKAHNVQGHIRFLQFLANGLQCLFICINWTEQYSQACQTEPRCKILNYEKVCPTLHFKIPRIEPDNMRMQ